MSLKDKFENHPVVWGLTLIVVGAVSGFGFNEMITDKTGTSPSSYPATSAAQINCSVEGLGMLTEGHHLRVTALQDNLMTLEKQSTDPDLFSSDQKILKESADRVRMDIDLENNLYKDNISSLEKKCK